MRNWCLTKPSAFLVACIELDEGRCQCNTRRGSDIECHNFNDLLNNGFVGKGFMGLTYQQSEQVQGSRFVVRAHF